ncbi:MAG: NAD-dependent protein deacetylase [Panacagrimonas sp.]
MIADPATALPLPTGSALALRDFVLGHRRLFVLTGAGCSTDSGIPDYRDREGQWKRKAPVTHQAFMSDAAVRGRYWARSLVGWPVVHAARPNAAHRVLAQLEQGGRLGLLVTQNVDGLHRLAGHREVLDLHGRIDRVVCQVCGAFTHRQDLQRQLVALNPDWAALAADQAPDGDADLDALDFSGFVVPDCEHCGGLLKPDVVFFGANVPAAAVGRAMRALDEADAMLVVGSSLMVYSGYRFAVRAAQRGLPIAALNLGRTRADELLSLKLDVPCGPVLQAAFGCFRDFNGRPAPPL